MFADAPDPSLQPRPFSATSSTDPNLAWIHGRCFDRELSWLDFNGRVLDLAADPDVPLLERVKFLAIFTSNLDEFCQIRYAGLRDRALQSPPALWGGAPARALWTVVAARIRELSARQEQLWYGAQRALADVGIDLVDDVAELTPDEQAELTARFDRDVFPALTPLAVDAAHPFPHISSLALNLAVVLRSPDGGPTRLARVKIPPSLPRFLAVSGGRRFVRIEQVVTAHLGALFVGMEIDAHATFRVTRDADLEIDDEIAEDLLESMVDELRQRRFGSAVRLEIGADLPAAVREVLLDELELTPEDVFVATAPLGMGSLMELWGLDRPDLRDDPWNPVSPPALRSTPGETGLFAALRRGDVLVHHPYESFATSVGAFVEEAADDPHVVAIKLALYRTSKNSPIIGALLRAAEAGKQVVVLIELKARFDEENNIGWARMLEEAGAHVMYGIVGLKTHAKIALVVRAETDGLRRYCHVGTGNYNPSTARIYEDVGLFSSNPQLGDDIGQLFNALTGYSARSSFSRLTVAPAMIRPRMLDLIRRESARGPEGLITLKMNSLVDDELIEALYAASGAGTPVQLVVRGICRLRPGVPGLSEHITVRSIVGRYLEHSRIFRFGHPEEPTTVRMIGSADLMQRNLDRRIEVLVDVEDAACAARLDEILDAALADDCFAWHLDGEGRWHRPSPSGKRSAQEQLHLAAQAR